MFIREDEILTLIPLMVRDPIHELVNMNSCLRLFIWTRTKRRHCIFSHLFTRCVTVQYRRMGKGDFEKELVIVTVGGENRIQ